MGLQRYIKGDLPSHCSKVCVRIKTILLGFLINGLKIKYNEFRSKSKVSKERDEVKCRVIFSLCSDTLSLLGVRGQSHSLADHRGFVEL